MLHTNPPVMSEGTLSRRLLQVNFCSGGDFCSIESRRLATVDLSPAFFLHGGGPFVGEMHDHLKPALLVEILEIGHLAVHRVDAVMGDDRLRLFLRQTIL
jgi:hypothetical protein